MWRWAFRSFLDERASLAASAGGVAVVFLLVMILEGAFQGEADQMVAFIERSGAAVWILQEGVSNVHMAASAVGEDAIAKVRKVKGVAEVAGILYGGGLAQIGREERALYLVGLRPGQRIGPWDLAAGRPWPRPGEAVVPEVLARRGGVGLGDVAVIARRPFRIAGLSRGTYSMANSLAFVQASDLASMFDIIADANFLLVWSASDVSAGDLAARIRATVPEVSVVERETLVANDRALGLQMGGELIRIMTLVASFVAALIVAFTVYTFSARRACELAVAKAVGAGAVQLLTASVAQAAALTLLGYAVAVGLAAALQPIFDAYAPGIIIHFTAGSLVGVGAAALGVAILAGAWPAWRVLRVDPTLVFSS